jgi:hypothetical protein
MWCDRNFFCPFQETNSFLPTFLSYSVLLLLKFRLGFLITDESIKSCGIRIRLKQSSEARIG